MVAISMVVTVAVVVVDVTVRHGFLVERTCSTVTSAPEAHAHDATGWATSTASTRAHTAAAAHRRPPTDPPPRHSSLRLSFVSRHVSQNSVNNRLHAAHLP